MMYNKQHLKMTYHIIKRFIKHKITVF